MILAEAHVLWERWDIQLPYSKTPSQALHSNHMHLVLIAYPWVRWPSIVPSMFQATWWNSLQAFVIHQLILLKKYLYSVDTLDLLISYLPFPSQVSTQSNPSPPLVGMASEVFYLQGEDSLVVLIVLIDHKRPAVWLKWLFVISTGCYWISISGSYE